MEKEGRLSRCDSRTKDWTKTKYRLIECSSIKVLVRNVRNNSRLRLKRHKTHDGNRWIVIDSNKTKDLVLSYTKKVLD